MPFKKMDKICGFKSLKKRVKSMRYELILIFYIFLLFIHKLFSNRHFLRQKST